MTWGTEIDTISSHVVLIKTPTSYGTGFLAFYNNNKTWCGIATAAHVVEHAEEWQLPIRIKHETSEKMVLLRADERVIMIDRPSDSAVVLFHKGDLGLPEEPLTLLPLPYTCRVGQAVGWLGYPAIEPGTLCFFSGTISAQRYANRSYFIDGVAINGVSGGPVFHKLANGNIHIIGCVSAYHANRTTGEALPGLLIAQDVSQFHESAETIRNIDEAIAKKHEFESEPRQQQ